MPIDNNLYQFIQSDGSMIIFNPLNKPQEPIVSASDRLALNIYKYGLDDYLNYLEEAYEEEEINDSTN